MTDQMADSVTTDHFRDQFLRDVLAGLTAPEKSLPCKYFYDEAGSKLFERICELPEYYPTRTERAILADNAEAIADACGRGGALIEPGAGSGEKTRLLLKAIAPAVFVPIDISADYLRAVASEIAADFPKTEVVPVAADFTGPMTLPESLSGLTPRTLFFPGSTIGNFTPGRATELLRGWSELVGGGGRMLIGVDLVKSAEQLEAAYDDAAGVTAEFNVNLLRRINRELDADLDVDAFRHRAVFEAETSRVEMHLVSLREQKAVIGGRKVDFAEGESVHTENSHKYTPESFAGIASDAGLRVESIWTDADRLFSVQLLRVV